MFLNILDILEVDSRSSIVHLLDFILTIGSIAQDLYKGCISFVKHKSKGCDTSLR